MWGISHSLLLATCNHSSAVQAVLHGAEGQFLFSYAVETAEVILCTYMCNSLRGSQDVQIDLNDSKV